MNIIKFNFIIKDNISVMKMLSCEIENLNIKVNSLENENLELRNNKMYLEKQKQSGIKERNENDELKRIIEIKENEIKSLNVKIQNLEGFLSFFII